MTSLINKIELLIKREKTTPERKKDDPPKSSSEILSELFGAFNADPPKIEEISVKKSKKSKKKHKKEKKKRSRSSSSSSSDDSDYSHRRKKRKKSKSIKYRTPSPPPIRSRSPKTKPPEPARTKSEANVKSGAKDKSDSKAKSDSKVKSEPNIKIESNVKNGPSSKSELDLKNDSNVKSEAVNKSEDVKVKKEEMSLEPEPEPKRRVSIKINTTPEPASPPLKTEADLIPMPTSPITIKMEPGDLRQKLDSKKAEAENDKAKGKIQIKNLKFSTVFEETVKKAEEEARKRAEKYEEGEYTDSSSESVKEVVTNSQFPKTSDPGGLKKAAEESKIMEEVAKSPPPKKTKKPESSSHSHKSSKRDSSKSKRSSSKSRRSRSRSTTRKRRHRSTSKSRKSRSRHRSSSRSRRRSGSRSRKYSRHHSPRYRGRRSRSPTGVRLADSEKKRLLEVARRNAINMLKNGAVPAGAAALPPHTRNQVMAAIQSGGKSVDELTDFCKHLSKKEALGELSSVSSHEDGMSENEDTIAFHHPFLVKEKAPIIMNIRGGAPLPTKSTSLVPIANKDELRLQFPVSSGSQHREKASEWRPVSPKKDKDNMQVAKLNSKQSSSSSAPKAIESSISTTTTISTKSTPLALPEPSHTPPMTPPPDTAPGYSKTYSNAPQMPSGPLALPAPGPQAYPPGVEPPKAVTDMAKIVTQKLQMIRKEQEQNELTTTRGFGWSKDASSLGQFTGSTGAQILTPRELASGTQAWAKKDQLTRAAPVEGGMGMHLLQKMGWTPGRGLGKEGTGTLQPLLLEVKLDTKGLQAKEEVSSSRNSRGMRHARGRGLGRGVSGVVSAGLGLAAGGKHPVSLLGEYCSKQKLGPPEYNLCFECGPDHKKNFLFKVKVAGIEYQPAVASQNKKQAKADAAQLALQKLGILTV